MGQGATDLVRRAVEGLLLGLVACTPSSDAAGPRSPVEPPRTAAENVDAAATDTVTVPRSDAVPMEPRRATIPGSRDAGCQDDPHANECKGLNDCKGLGGCKTETNDCRGKNDCKGKGGCKTASPDCD